jgi:hypothetical protein
LEKIAISTSVTTMAVRSLAEGDGWRVAAQICAAEPYDRIDLDKKS